MEDLEHETREGYEKLIAVNQTAVWLGMKAAAAELAKNRSTDLEAVANDIELKLKLASMDVRDKWRTAFEPKLFEARMHAREAKEHSK